MASMTKRFACAALLAAGCAALLTAGCTDGGRTRPDDATIDATPRQTVMEVKTLLAHDIVEATLTGGPGDRAVLHLIAPDAKLDWNIHGHTSAGSQNVVEGFAQRTVDFAFQPASQAEWSLLLRNQGDAPFSVDVRIELFGDITWSGWQ